jgi:tRNA dimethylallyltransferase
MYKTVLVLVGPTAVGKTALSLVLARRFATEIISADSRQCFKELTIGVAKPSLQELSAIPHHFINSHSITETVTAATFETYALNKLDEIFKHHDVAVMVGGTGLYVKAFCEGLDDIPTVDEKLRKELIAEYEQNGLQWLQKELNQHDPFFASKGEMQNPQRMLRALEVIRSTGKSVLQFRIGNKQQRPFRILKIGLELSREELYSKINRRVDSMMQDGLLSEVESLISFQQLNALQTVGYRELFDYFNGVYTLDQAVEKIKQNTRHYAKRQLTWFTKDKEIHWFNALESDKLLQFLLQK